MSILEELFGGSSGNSTDSDKEVGVVWASFERKYEVWHFGPDDEKEVTYDYEKDGVLYRFVDDEKDEGYGSSSDRSIRVENNVELVVDDSEKWRDKRKANETMYVVAKGWWDGNRMKYYKPTLIVDKDTFKAIKSEVELSNPMAGTPRPHGV